MTTVLRKPRQPQSTGKTPPSSAFGVSDILVTSASPVPIQIPSKRIADDLTTSISQDLDCAFTCRIEQCTIHTIQ